MAKPDLEHARLIFNALDDTFEALDLGLNYEQTTKFIMERRTDRYRLGPQSYIVPKEEHWAKLKEDYNNACVTVRKACIKMSSTT